MSMKEAFELAGITTEGVEVGPKTAGTSGQEIVDQLAEPDTVKSRTDSEVPEPTADDAEALSDLVQDTPWWISQYYVWKQSANGRYYLAPRESVMEELINMVPVMLKAGYDCINSGDTDEAASVQRRIAAITELDQDDKALNWDTLSLKRRLQMRDEAILRGFYAAQTQLELNEWATRLAASKKPQPETFDEKRNRGREQAMQAAVLFSVVEGLEEIKDRKGRAIRVTPDAIRACVRERMWQSARYNTNDLLNPHEQQARQDAAEASDKVNVSMF